MYGDALVVRMGVGGEALVEAAVARGHGALGWTRRHLWAGVDVVSEAKLRWKSEQAAVPGSFQAPCNTILRTTTTHGA